MPTALDPAAMPRLSSVERLMAGPHTSNPSPASGEAGTTCFPDEGRPQELDPTIDVDHERAVPASSRARRRIRNVPCADDSRWLLYLQDMDGNENWHLFRVDAAAPEKPAMDLTPLPQGSRVFTVDPLATMPGSVLVTMNNQSEHVDYFLIEVATGKTTARLPAGQPG